MAKPNSSGAQKGKGAARRSSGQPQSVKTMEKFLAQQKKLAAEIAATEKSLTDARKTRRKELQGQLGEEDKLHTANAAVELKRHGEMMGTLKAELDPLETALGITPPFDLSDIIPLSAGGDGASAAVNGISWGIAKPKDLDVGQDAQGNQYDEGFWDKIMVWPGQEEEATMTSLDGFMLLVLCNANGEQVSTPVGIAAVQAMGHETSSANFQASFSTANGRLKEKGYVKKAKGRGYHVITAAGKKACAKLVAEQDAAVKEEAGEGGDDGASSTGDCILVAIDQAGGTIAATKIGAAVTKAGYVSTGKPTEEVKADLKSALASLKDEGLIQFTKAGDETQFKATPAGAKRAKQVAA
jgi:hypothetical protein